MARAQYVGRILLSLGLIVGFTLLIVTLGPSLSASEEQLDALKVADWNSLGIYYVWKRPCQDVMSTSRVHQALKKRAAVRRVTLHELEDRPSPDSDKPIIILACTGYRLGTDRVLGLTLGLERGVRYSVDGSVYSSRLFGGGMSQNVLRFNAGYHGARTLLVDSSVDTLDGFLDNYVDTNRASGSNAVSPGDPIHRSPTGLEVADWSTLPLLVDMTCADLFDVETLIAEVLRENGLKLPGDYELTLQDEIEIAQPTIMIYCTFVDLEELDPFYRLDILLLRPAVYSDGRSLRRGLASTTPKLILGGAGSAMGGLVTKGLDIEESFTRVWSAFLKKLVAANQ